LFLPLFYQIIWVLPLTKFVFDLEPFEGATRLRFTHGGWREATDFFASCNFRWGFYMQSLKEYCEDGRGTSFQES